MYKHIRAGTIFNGLKFSFIHLNSYTINKPVIKLSNLNKARIISCINTLYANLSKDLESLISATKYIKEVDGKSDRVTIRNYINTGKLYKNK